MRRDQDMCKAVLNLRVTIEKPFDNVDEVVVPKRDAPAPFERCWTKIYESRRQCQS